MTMKPSSAFILLSLLAVSCTSVPLSEDVLIRAALPPSTRSNDPDEALITDLNVFIFNESGKLEEKRFISGRELEKEDGNALFRTRLFQDGRYSVYLCANLGYELPVRTLDGLLSFRYHFTYPDEYGKGMPMTGFRQNACPADEGGEMTVPLERLMAKVSLRLDRTALRDDVRIIVRRVRIGACPSSALLFGESRVESERHLFLNGFSKEDRQVLALNRELTGVSGVTDLYLLENLQGREQSRLCSYIELEMEYYSDGFHTKPGQYLVYRFYPGEGEGLYDIRRNSHYRYTVRPAGDGLDGDGWRVDRSGLEKENSVYFDLHPAAYNEVTEKKTFHLWCDVRPGSTPFEFEALAWDDSESVSDVYDYQIDETGKGLYLTPKKAGTALIYFKAGPPVSKDTLALVVFNL